MRKNPSGASPNPSAVHLAHLEKKAKTAPAVEPLLLSVNEARARLAIGNSLVWKLIASGELQTIKLGGRTLVPMSALHAMIAAKAVV
jgi:excisionase family DNA binding protein